MRRKDFIVMFSDEGSCKKLIYEWGIKVMKTTQEIQSVLMNPEIFEINRLKAHSDHRYYKTLTEAISKVQMTWRRSLNGE